MATPRRVPSGVTTGGQFASCRREESGVCLTDQGCRTPLKDQTPAELAELIRDEMCFVHGDSDQYQAVHSSTKWAGVLHEGQRRNNPTMTSAGMPLAGSEPYVVHPLRNAARIIRWGETDADIVVAAIMHDTVEDQADRLLAGGPQPAKRNATERRKQALEVISSCFGGRVASIVEAVSNPIRPSLPVLSAEQKRDLYAEHVRGVIGASPVFMVKAADFVDNALGLHHQPLSPTRDRLARKYLPLCGISPVLRRPTRMPGTICTPIWSASLLAHTTT